VTVARPDLSVSRDSGDDYPSYYGRPVIKEPVWSWEIPWYFFTGGLAGSYRKPPARAHGAARLARCGDGEPYPPDL
jgi:hypothetical protein